MDLKLIRFDLKTTKTQLVFTGAGVIGLIALSLFAFRKGPSQQALIAQHASDRLQYEESAPVCRDLIALFESSETTLAVRWSPRKWIRSVKDRVISEMQLNDSGQSDLARSDQQPQQQPSSAQELAVFGLSQKHKDFSRGFNFAEVSRVTEQETDLKSVLPSQLAPSQDAGGIATQVLNHGLSQFFNGDMMKSTALGKAAKSVENTMKTDVAIGGSSPESTQHKIQFQVNAPAAQAFVQYSGLTNATLRYNIARQSAELELSEPLSGAATMVFNHNSGPAERRDVLSIRVPW